jgi:DNA-binding XRE family transcriptional regulator
MIANINLKMLRAKYGKTQSEIARHLGLSLVGYHKKENGLRPWTLEEAKHLSELFGMPIEAIFFEEMVHASGTVAN